MNCLDFKDFLWFLRDFLCFEHPHCCTLCMGSKIQRFVQYSPYFQTLFTTPSLRTHSNFPNNFEFVPMSLVDLSQFYDFPTYFNTDTQRSSVFDVPHLKNPSKSLHFLLARTHFSAENTGILQGVFTRFFSGTSSSIDSRHCASVFPSEFARFPLLTGSFLQFPNKV
jgi:hypothetical protein